MGVSPPRRGLDWIGITVDPLPVERALSWAEMPGCGAVVLFSGNVRDHAPGRPGVTSLEYEAYTEEAARRLQLIASEARRRWPALGRVVLLHRLGRLRVGEAAVVVVASAPHRDEAFAAARFGIDEVKASVPIWKNECWDGGQGWSAQSQALGDLGARAR